ncbi:glycosyltransferase [Sphingobium abikonense]|uniref:glycosyltransferase n=1 Tax=Sphingobium abikonense TaxID=86193 RepID=UPI000788E5AD|nr:glycosyltransferase [Sphingobium abikonense]
MFQHGVGSRDDLSAAIYLYRPGDGGLDRVAIMLANHMARQGKAVELWMAHTDGVSAHLVDSRVPVRRVAAPGGNRRLSMIAQFPALAAMVRRHRPDILYSAGNQSNMLVALACLGTTTRSVARISNPICPAGRRDLAAWARWKRFCAISRISDLTIVMGEHDRALLGRSGTVRLLPRPTVTPIMDKVRMQRQPRDADAPYQLLMVGRLVEQKDHATALSALARLSHLDWRLTIVGEGPLRAALAAQAAALGIGDRVVFTGYVADPERLANLMGQADLLLQPSRWEGLCATLIEALACGANVVATDSTPNIRPVLAAAGQHPPVPTGDSAALAQAIGRTLARPAPMSLMEAAIRDHRAAQALDAYVAAFADLIPSPVASILPSPAWP